MACSSLVGTQSRRFRPWAEGNFALLQAGGYGRILVPMGMLANLLCSVVHGYALAHTEPQGSDLTHRPDGARLRGRLSCFQPARPVSWQAVWVCTRYVMCCAGLLLLWQQSVSECIHPHPVAWLQLPAGHTALDFPQLWLCPCRVSAKHSSFAKRQSRIRGTI